MKILDIYPDSINERHIDEAVAALRRGEVIVYPTDTFYALGCDALNNRAIEKPQPLLPHTRHPDSENHSFTSPDCQR
ncbi:L-threonylcarbamoyladenylate synthase [uncultured Duncaniella sp.]|uniref:L-threonylcarbamoyladenylate synthase n=1 Tax=uncultured Duncaniella sp. TaxID=2768039 RepID=UPI002676C02E|nr:Sua5/YciO/YrdC/YwlC family protein [uncultured Duncaniella sp.]